MSGGLLLRSMEADVLVKALEYIDDCFVPGQRNTPITSPRLSRRRSASVIPLDAFGLASNERFEISAREAVGGLLTKLPSPHLQVLDRCGLHPGEIVIGHKEIFSPKSTSTQTTQRRPGS